MAREHRGKTMVSKEGVDIIECETCGFRHVLPLPTSEELQTTYQIDYYDNEKPLYIERSKEDENWYRLLYSDRFDTFEENLPEDRRNILDVGSGPGFFLKYGQERGWQVLGIEPSKQASTHARSMGIEVVEDFLNEESAKSLGKFDVIHSSLVLEHIPNPIELVEIIYDLIKPGGLICISVPNDFNPFQQALLESDNYSPWWIVPSHHLNYFTPASLSKLLQTCGFSILMKESTFPMDMFLLMGDNYIGNDSLGRSSHKKRIRFEEILNRSGQNGLKREIYKQFAKLNIGREICAYGIKK